MAKFTFRQGIARRQEDGVGNPIFLQPNGNYMDLIVSPDPTTFLIAHGDTDYMFSESLSVTQAWGPFTGVSCWLYWDVSFLTGEITRGFTTRSPVSQSTPPANPDLDQHWFDTATTKMKRWDGACWAEVIRVFALYYENAAVMHHYPIGTQVGITGGEYYAGTPLFDPNGKPLQVWQRDRRGQFITTETPMHAQFSPLANFRVEAAINQAEAVESVPIHYAVAYTGGANMVRLARNTIPSSPSIGIAAEDMIPGEVRSFVTKGFVSDATWNWTEPSGTKIFVGETGALVTTPPTIDSIQEMGMIVDPKTVFINPQSLKILNRGSVQSGNYVPMYTDRTTGEEVMWDRTATPGTMSTIGFVHTQSPAASVWTITHNVGTTTVSVQVTDENNEVIIPWKIQAIDGNTVEISFDEVGGSPAIEVEGSALLTLFV